MIQIIGHEAELRHLLAIDAHKAQSLLLEGCAGIGKKSIAMLVAAKILGAKSLSEAHPDFFLLEKSIDQKTGKEKAEIAAEDARKLAKFMTLTPAQSEFRVAIIDSADRLNATAANAILKIVEEPPRNSVIILLAHEGMVLPTIRSRCQRVYFRPLDKSEMAKILAHELPDLSAEDREILSEVAEGSPGAALEIYENKGLELVKDLAEILANPHKANYDRLAKFAASVNKSDKTWRAYKLIVSWITNKMARTSLYGLPLQLGAHQIKAKDALRLAALDAELHGKIHECEVFNMDKKVLIVNSISDLLRSPAASL